MNNRRQLYFIRYGKQNIPEARVTIVGGYRYWCQINIKKNCRKRHRQRHRQNKGSGNFRKYNRRYIQNVAQFKVGRSDVRDECAKRTARERQKTEEKDTHTVDQYRAARTATIEDTIFH